MFFPALGTLIFHLFSVLETLIFSHFSLYWGLWIFHIFPCIGDFDFFYVFHLYCRLWFFMFFLLLATFDFYMSSCVLETLRFNKFFCLVIELNFHILEILISRFFLCGWLVTLSFHFHLSPFFYTNCEVHVNSEHLNLSMHDFACKVLRISRNIRAPVSRILKSNGGDELVMLRCSIWCYDYRYVCV